MVGAKDGRRRVVGAEGGEREVMIACSAVTSVFSSCTCSVREGPWWEKRQCPSLNLHTEALYQTQGGGGGLDLQEHGDMVAGRGEEKKHKKGDGY